jgi:MSHA biogenesis protein MshL
VQASGAGGSGAGSGSQSQTTNATSLRIKNESKNQFWATLEKNMKDLLRETDKLLPDGSSETFISEQGRSESTGSATTRQSKSGNKRSARTSTEVAPGDRVNANEATREERTLTFREAASVIVNAETGIVSVRATNRQHEKVAEFLRGVTQSAKRQVLVEATVVEVVLNDKYQSGVDWASLASDSLGYSFRINTITGAVAQATGGLTGEYKGKTGTRDLSSAVKLLNSFGDTRVLSSPRLMVINNQTAVLKVVDNFVYFNITAQTVAGSTNSLPITTYSTQQSSVPVGLVMNVTPQIDENDQVTLSVRPSVSRIIGFVDDPNPSLAQVRTANRVPQIQTREIESVMRVRSGDTAVLGGLMQDSLETSRDGLPVLSRIPVIGDGVSARNDSGRKSELVVFLRPIVVREASIDGDLTDYRRYLPGDQFFKDSSPVFNALPR